MEESQMEADRAGGEVGEGRGGWRRIKLPRLSTEPLASALESVKALAKSYEERIRGGLWKRTVDSDNGDRRLSNPIDILKRLQREAFFEIMKLRDRQDKVERTLALYKTSKGGPFHEDSTRMKGLVDVAGALLFAGRDGQETADLLDIAGIKTGIDSRFVFETVTRQKDTLMAEFVASQDNLGIDISRSPLKLSKVLYLANISNQSSLVAVPLGARCRDFTFGSSLFQFQGLAEPSSDGPPLLNQDLGCAAGFRVRCSNITASLAQAVSRLDMQVFSSSKRCSATFGQVDCLLPARTRASLLGLFPTGNVSSGSLAGMLESGFDDSSRIRGWVEFQKSNLKSFQWALSLADTPEDEVGWGVTIGGYFGGNRRRVQLESYLKVGVGKRFSLQPGFVYTMDGGTQFPAMVLRTCWAL